MCHSNYRLRSLVAVMLFSMVALTSHLSAKPPRGFDGDINKITDVLVDRGQYTLVPKRSILFVPKGMESKLVRQKKTRNVSFQSFYRKNQTWLYKLEVTLAEAEGRTPISKERMDRISKLGKVVVAVYKGGAITVESPKNTKLTEVTK